MALLGISNLCFSFGDRRILDGANLTLNEGEHVGLVGLNGCGKSTLMKMIAGIGPLKPDDGQVQLARGSRAGYLTQDPVLDLNRTLRQEAGAAFEKLYKLHEQIDKLHHEMETATGDALDTLLKKYEVLQHDMEAEGGYAVDHRIDAMLHGLGLEDGVFNVKVRDLSGGQKGRLSLAKLLLSDPDLLLLDEPTNHLDIEGRMWLEEYLASCNAAVVLISHDRWLLDRCVTKIYELHDGVLEEYPGNYHKYRELRAERRAFRQREYEKQRDRVKSEQAFIDRYRAGQRARQAQGREKRLERFKTDEMVDRPLTEIALNLRMRSTGRAGDQVILAEQISKGYPGKPLFGSFDFLLKRCDRIGIIGPNGCGKSTLVRCLLGQIEPDSGARRVGAQVNVGYYHQSHEHLDGSLTVIEHLRRVTGVEQTARDLAGAFLFSGQDQDKPLKVLSGGERSRAALAGLVAGGHNLLVLDEPTNHLDIPSSERLEEALCSYASAPKGMGANATGGGTLLIITHDRMLLENTVNQLIIFDGKGNVEQFTGTYSEYLQSKQRKSQAAAPLSPPPSSPLSPPPSSPRRRGPRPTSPPATPKPKRSGKFNAISSSKLEEKIEKLNATIKEIDAQLCDGEIYRDVARFKQLQRDRVSAAKELTEHEAEWLSRAECNE